MLDIPDQAVSVAPVVVAAVRYLAHPHVGLRVHVVPASKAIRFVRTKGNLDKPDLV